MKRRLGLLCALSLLGLWSLGAQHGAGRGEEPAVAEHAAEAETGHLTFWKLANFVLFAAVLGYFLRKKAGGFFQARTEEIRRGITEASRLKKEAEERYAAMEARLAGLGSEIESLRAKARQESSTEEARIREAMSRDMEKIQAEARREIEGFAKAARMELRAYSAELATRLAEVKIRRRLTPDAEQSFLSAMLADLENRPQARVS